MTVTRRSLLSSALISAFTLRAQLSEPRYSDQGAAASALPAAIAALKDRRSEAVPITSAEREGRIVRARDLMGQKSFAAICIAGGTTLSYFTGIRWWNSERLMLVVLPVKGQPFAVCPAFEEERLQERLAQVSAMAQTRLYTWQENENPYDQVAVGLKELAIGNGTVGIEETMPYVFAEGVARVLP